MQTPQRYFSKLILVVILSSLLFFNGCGNDQTSNQNAAKPMPSNSEVAKENRASDNIDELLNLVRLPEVPEEVVWREEVLGSGESRVPGPTDKKLIAVLKYTPEGSAKLVALVEKLKQPEQVEVGVENWFPEELTAQAQLSGGGMLKGTAYGANEFFNIPYGNGRITQIKGTDYFVLELATN